MDNEKPLGGGPGYGSPQGGVVEGKSSGKKIVFAVVALLLIIGAGWFGFKRMNKAAPTSPSVSQGLYKGKITIGYTVWPGYLGLYLAKSQGYFKELGLDVDVVLYPSFVALSDDYLNGKIQGKANLTLDAIDEAYRKLDHKVILAIDHSNGADGIAASSKVKSFADIKGKKVGYEFGTLEEFFIRYALEQNKLTLADIKPVNLDAEHAAAALVKGDLDVAVTYEPFLTNSLKKISGNKIFSSADAPGLITDVLTFRTSFIESYPETIDAILQAYFKGLDFWKANPAQANEVIGKSIGAAADEVAVQLEGIDVLDKRDNQTAFTFAGGFESLYGNMRRIGAFVQNQRYPNEPKVDTDKMIENKFFVKFIN